MARDAAAAFGRAFTEGEIDAFLELLAPEVDYESPSVIEHSVVKLKGRDEVRDYLERTTSEYERLEVAPEEVRDLGGGRFLMVGRWLAQPRQTPTPVGTPVGAVFDISDGKVARLRAFLDEQLAADAARRD